MSPSPTHDTVGQSDKPGKPTADNPDAHAWDSQALLKGQPWVWIRHQGVLYRLQATRQGKLILTK